jgi:hemolysin III
MAKRIKLSDRILPDYTTGEERMNMVTHIVGGAFGMIALALCLNKAVFRGDGYDLSGAIIYGVSMIGLYTIGAVLYGIGSKVRWMHSIFHIFVVLGSLLQFLSILLYAI